MKRYLACLAIGLLSMPACADEIKKDLLSCSALTDSIKRLECFDKLAAQHQEQADAQAAVEIDAGESAPENWNVRISQSKIDDSTSVFLITNANETVPGRYGNRVRPWLVLRCLENTTSAYINFDGHFMADIQGYGNVTFRVDKQKAFVRSMQASTDSSSLGLWRGGTSIPFIKQLFGGSTLLVQATPYNESSITFTLNIEGVETAIKPLRSACNW